jgi:hypothetical protein
MSVTPATCLKLPARLLSFLRFMQAIWGWAQYRMRIRAGRTHPHNLGVDWITPNFATGSRHAGSILLGRFPLVDIPPTAWKVKPDQKGP